MITQEASFWNIRAESRAGLINGCMLAGIMFQVQDSKNLGPVSAVLREATHGEKADDAASR